MTSRRARRIAVTAGLFGFLIVLSVASLGLGSRHIDLQTVRASFLAYNPAIDEHLIIWSLRAPRTLIAILAGVALGVAGALTQAVTRNPLAEPGLLGVNAGAATAVIFGVVVLGIHDIASYVWLGFAGAAASACAVLLLGRAGRSGTDPVRLVLAGAGLSIVLGSVTGVVVLNAPVDVLDNFRNWAAGSVEGRGFDIAGVLALAVVFGSIIAMAISSNLNAIALGEELGRSLGASAGATMIGACGAVTLLAGAATAAAGPITFLGLVAPQITRSVIGPDCRWTIPVSGLTGGCVLLLSDIVGRIVVAPEEIAAGIVVLLIGGPSFICAARHFRLGKA
ncbi:FecCD family ABC transporter permease [Agrobacterium tumefaciens]|uniref:FecCD family ABC transporter permease n=1 Tax=Agrobacterium tumefaciens TaxID=358 RepID=UPI0021D11103|nr:iron ABC transporter permease [Agrobacterium tumefaciens]UXS03742.1 iron ABC transporter permease [Agrobacterium tumefaciens]